MPTKFRVLIVDDHAVVREGLKSLLHGQADLEVVGEAADGAQALEQAAALLPDLVVLDVSLPGTNGVAVAEALWAAHPRARVVALSVHEDRGYVKLMMAAGAAGYVLKRSAAEELLRALREVAAGRVCVNPALVGGALAALPGAGDDRPAAGLSQREEETLKLIAEGFTNKEIAAKLSLSVKTVETYKTRSLEKLGLRTRVELVRYGLRQGWLTDAPRFAEAAVVVGPPA